MSAEDTVVENRTVEELVAGFRPSPELERCLADLERRVDPAVEDRLRADYVKFLDGAWPEPIFTPRRPPGAAPGCVWPDIRVNAAIGDFNRMALQQFGACSRLLKEGDGAPLAVRANYGVGISSAWFGCPVQLMPEEINTLPTSVPLDDRARMDALAERGVPDVTAGYSARVFAMGHIFRSLLAGYPRLRRYVCVYHPDIQSPIDTAELVWGSDILLAFYEEPERAHRLLDVLTETYIVAVRRWSAIHPFAADGIHAHWNFMHKGNIALRTDSGMNLSPDMYAEFIQPYEQRCLDACGGGINHFCGRGDHFIALMTQARGLHGIAMSQPHLNDMETIFRHTVDRGIPLLGFSFDAARAARAAGRDLRGLVLVHAKA